ncbi:hypothetical protein LSAT2_002580 [Lamellibrachia satsuma]|nr:hypothetical protein LSAT2_002580 [Lamellibrachia satsuma]
MYVLYSMCSCLSSTLVDALPENLSRRHYRRSQRVNADISLTRRPTQEHVTLKYTATVRLKYAARGQCYRRAVHARSRVRGNYSNRGSPEISAETTSQPPDHHHEKPPVA